MKVLERLKLELNNKDYFTDPEYTVFLLENNLVSTDEYNKTTMQRSLLITCVDILEALSNDVDMMRKVSDSDTISTSEAAKFLEDRISKLKQRISTIPDSQGETDSIIRPLFVRGC